MATKKKAPVTEELKIPKPNIKNIMLTIVGTTPLIVNRFSERAMDEIEKKQTSPAGSKMAKRKVRDPEAEYEGSIYLMKDGKNHGIKAMGFKNAMIDAAGTFTEFPKTSLRRAIHIDRDLLKIEFDEKDLHMDRSVVRLAGPSRPADLRYRARYEKWSVKVPLKYNADIIDKNSVVNLASLASNIGLHEHRPDKNGTFGQFDVTEVHDA